MMKALKIVGWTLLSLVLVVIAVACIAMYVIFTPERLTPVVRKAADQFITCEHEIGEVELTFFSTFSTLSVFLGDSDEVNGKKLPRKYPMTGMSPWNPPNHNAMMTMDLWSGSLIASPLQMETANASIASPTEMRISATVSTGSHPYINIRYWRTFLAS